MKVREIMTKNVVRIHPDEPVEVAARALTHYNVGAMPVCGSDGRLCGMVTDRDLVIRCLSAGKDPNCTRVREVMSGSVICVPPDMDSTAAAALMGRKQIRRLPVVENGRLRGMVSLADLANNPASGYDAADALEGISANISGEIF